MTLNERLTRLEALLEDQISKVTANSAEISKLTRAVSLWNVLLLGGTAGILVLIEATSKIILK